MTTDDEINPRRVNGK